MVSKPFSCIVAACLLISFSAISSSASLSDSESAYVVGYHKEPKPNEPLVFRSVQKDCYFVGEFDSAIGFILVKMYSCLNDNGVVNTPVLYKVTLDYPANQSSKVILNKIDS